MRYIQDMSLVGHCAKNSVVRDIIFYFVCIMSRLKIVTFQKISLLDLNAKNNQKYLSVIGIPFKFGVI